jgi:SWI/SNF-related matrix-associated actin-dependent regulator of chromatin subfamily D
MLRVFLSCTTENSGDNEVTWSLKVDGKLMDDAQKGKRKFSSFIRRMFVEFDEGGSEVKSAEWQRSTSMGESDGFDVTRKGMANGVGVAAKVLLYLHHDPAKFELAEDFATMVGLFHATRHDAIAALWQYIKDHQLQDKEEPEFINCDPYMQKIFQGAARIRFTDIPGKLNRLLLPPSPVVLEYIIPMTVGVSAREIYDVEVEVDDGNRDNIVALFDDIEPEVNTFQDQISALKGEIDEAREKREFMMNFARDPKEFLVCWLASEARENQSAEQGQLTEEQRTAAYYNDHKAQEAVYRYYASVLQERTNALKVVK